MSEQINDTPQEALAAAIHRAGLTDLRPTSGAVLAVITHMDGWSLVPTAEVERLTRYRAQNKELVLEVKVRDGLISALQQQLAAQAQRVNIRDKALRDLLDCMPPCRCSEGFTSRNLVDPDCARHYDFDEEVIDAARRALTEASDEHQKRGWLNPPLPTGPG